MSVWDLHCHSTASDGELSPVQLVQRAAGCGVSHLAITDHDTVEGLRAIRGLQIQLQDTSDTVRSIRPAPQIISGVEVTARSQGQVVHIIGLWIDIDSVPLNQLLDGQQQKRAQRGKMISERLEAKGLPPTFYGALAHADGSALGRPHFARYLEEIGVVENVGQAFKHWLGRGKAGDVEIDWPEVDRVVDVIHAAGGLAVLAHPAKYHLGYGKMYSMCEQFKEVGGDAIEVISGAQQFRETRDLKRIADRLELAASTGSDFHSPKQLWCDLGSQPLLPEACLPVWELREEHNKKKASKSF